MLGFGLFLTGTIGYGFAIILLVGVWAAALDMHRARTSPSRRAPDGSTVHDNSKLFVVGVLASLINATLTTFILRALA